MEINSILTGKQLKAKMKVESISKMLINKQISISELISIAKNSKEKDKGTCIQAIESATRAKTGIATQVCFDFVTEALADKAPRVKWESAKVIGNTVHLFPGKTEKAINSLLANSEFPGTVVRWSAAFALGEIVKLKTGSNKYLIPAIESIIKREDNNAVRKIYQAALKHAST